MENRGSPRLCVYLLLHYHAVWLLEIINRDVWFLADQRIKSRIKEIMSWVGMTCAQSQSQAVCIDILTDRYTNIAGLQVSIFLIFPVPRFAWKWWFSVASSYNSCNSYKTSEKKTTRTHDCWTVLQSRAMKIRIERTVEAKQDYFAAFVTGLSNKCLSLM